MPNKKRILVFAEYYLPGIKGGGPITTIKNMVDALSDFFEFRIVTLDRDLGDKEPYKGIKKGWNEVGDASVLYLGPKETKISGFIKILKEEEYDAIYFNSFFSVKFTLKPLIAYKRLKLKKQMIIAPRGEFSKGALQLKSHIKKLYLMIAKRLFPLNKVIFQASSEFEKNDIKAIFKEANVVIAPNIRTKPIENLPFENKTKGMLKIVFLSRISPKKNLLYALEVLKEIKGELYFEIYGPIEDKEYWNKCNEIIKNLPANVKVSYCGQIKHDKVIETLNNYHLFFLPTLGENYGHVIHEALLAGCPVLISDQTPWKDLQKKGVGWDIPLKQKEEFTKAISFMIQLSNKEFRELSKKARQYGAEVSRDKTVIEANKNLFRKS